MGRQPMRRHISPRADLSSECSACGRPRMGTPEMRLRVAGPVFLLWFAGGLSGCQEPLLAGVDGKTTGPGGIMWHVPTAQPPLLSATIAADDSTAFYYLTGRRFTALRLRDQRTLWTATGDESSHENNAMRGV